MAGIILDLNDDIQRLQELKREIQEVKQALTSINVKVDIDIAKGLEDRLKSLMGTYGDLVAKVSQAEASVKASASRMADATRKVTEAQEKASSSGGGKRDGAESVKEQAKAYEELAAEIDAVMGTREQNIKRMVEEQNAIRLIGKEIKALQSSQSLGPLSKSEQARLESLNASLMAHKTALSELRQSLANGFKLDNAAATSMNALSQSLGRMRMAYRELSEQERESPFGKQLLASIQQADQKIKELDATIGNHQRNVGNYASGWNGLGTSVQQIVRELPSATMGLNMFFMAISNNLPILTDEIKRAAEANKQMKAQGKETVPVWKQLVSSLFSWQSAMMVGITLLTVYGKDIANWIGNLFKAEDALEETRKAQERFAQFQKKMTNEWRESVAQTAGEQIAQYRRLSRQWDQLGDNLKAKERFVRDNQDAFHQLGFSVSGVSEAERLFVGNTDAVVNALVARAKAAAYEQTITKATQRYIEQTEYNKGTVKGGGYYKKVYASDVVSRKRAEELGLKYGEDYFLSNAMNGSNYIPPSMTAPQYTYSKITSNEIVLTAAGAAKENAKRAEEAAKRLRENNERATKEWNRVVKAATEGLERQTEAENAVYDKLSLKRYNDRGGTSAGKDAEREADKREEAEENADKNLLELRRQNQESELSLMKDGTEKQLKEIELRYEKQKDAIKKQAADMAKENQEAGVGGLNAKGLTQEQQTEIDKAYELAEEARKKSVDEANKAEAGAMRDYLKQYGTYQQQKLAIAEEYAEKIKNAQTEGERLSLEAERDRSLQQVEINAIRQNIDWGSVFGDFGAMFKDQLQPTIDQLRQIAGSDTFKQSSLEDQKTLYELIDKLEQSNAVWDSDIFKRVSDDLEAYQQSLLKLIAAQDRERAAIANYENARKSLDAARETGDQEKIEAAGKAVESASAEMEAASSDVREFGSQAQKATADLNASSEQARTMFEGLAEGLRGLSSGTIQGVWEGLSRLDTLFNEGDMTKDIGNALAKGLQSLFGKDSSVAKSLSDALGNSGALGAIISAILSIIDQLAEQGIGGIVSGLIDTILGAINGILDNILSGKFIEQIGNSLVDGIGGILNTISFGGFNSLMNIGSNAKEVAENIARLTERNDALIDSLDALRESLDDSVGAQAVEMAKQAMEQQREVNQNYLDIAKNQAGYSHRHHSWNDYWGGFTREQIDRLSEQIGREWSGDLWDLSPEEMKTLKGNVDMWTRIQQTGKGGYGSRLTEKLDDYIDQAGALEEIEEQLHESLTQVSFDSLYDSFVDTLMDMDASAEDFADKFSEYMMRAVLSNKVGETMKDELERWYERFAGYMEDGTLTDMERADLKGWWDSMVDEGMSLRDQLAQAIGYEGEGGDEGQQASAGYELSTSQESVDILNGRLNAVYEAELRIEKNGELLYSVADEARGIIAQSFLELQQISENTGAIIVPIQKMQKDIEQVRKNTARL